MKAEAAVLGSPSLMVSVDVLLPAKDWALSERCNSCSGVCSKGGHGQCLGCY